MVNVSPVWEAVPEFAELAARMAATHPERFGLIDTTRIIAYKCTNEQKPQDKGVYDITGSTEPESFTNEKSYFVKFFVDEWESRTDEQKTDMVCSVLSRIDPAVPGRFKPN
ncbi:MAG: hypothetical protein O7D91_18640 [Planctomycetota bacterium]|nr:hypothetical protein [Planctomycetota bacterium]